MDYRLHRARPARNRVAAIERIARPHQVVVRGAGQEDAGRVGERAGYAGKPLPDRREGLHLAGVGGIVRLLGGDQMAHDQGGREGGHVGAPRQRGGLVQGQTEAVHAGVDVDRGRPALAGLAAGGGPFRDLLG